MGKAVTHYLKYSTQKFNFKTYKFEKQNLLPAPHKN